MLLVFVPGPAILGAPDVNAIVFGILYVKKEIKFNSYA